MPTLAPPIALFAGLATVLVLASATGAVLKHVLARGQPHAVIDNLNARVNAWWVMVAIVGAALAFAAPGLTALFALLSALALREFVAALRLPAAGSRGLVGGCFALLGLHYLALAAGWTSLHTWLLPLGGLVLLPLLGLGGQGKGQLRGFGAQMAMLHWGLMACVYAIGHLPALAWRAQGDGLLLVAFVLVVVQGSDVLQYIWGKLFGRHAMAPLLSPSKTWEGAVGGVASATALGAALHALTPYGPLAAAGLALLLCLAGCAGGLVMSAIKRDRGIKDWGDLIAGHGGVLDRLDSLVFAAPLAYYVVAATA